MLNFPLQSLLQFSVCTSYKDTSALKQNHRNFQEGLSCDGRGGCPHGSAEASMAPEADPRLLRAAFSTSTFSDTTRRLQRVILLLQSQGSQEIPPARREAGYRKLRANRVLLPKRRKDYTAFSTAGCLPRGPVLHVYCNPSDHCTYYVLWMIKVLHDVVYQNRSWFGIHVVMQDVYHHQ